ncbi:uncharacterized protein IL334_003520 [Kwoniella shivajii]|uniref:HMG box domain-containing protein n=1 Tax=Kwoniella shivajii TaxID=564305 RepID=A0ABZ1D0S0_9TREE|nr:hypothetical protein IL334_003520 [Kwoniella shivajii]
MLNLARPALMGIAAPLSARFAVRSFTSSVVVSKKKVVDPTLPVPPKGPPSAYTLFFKSYVLNPSNQTRNEQGKLNMRELATSAGSAWNSLPTTEKDEFEKEAKDARKSYESLYRQFWESTTSETRNEIEKQTGKKVKPPGGKKAYSKTIADRVGNPGKPLTPYFAFAKEIRDGDKVAIPNDLQGTEKLLFISKETGKLWKELTDDAKKTYKDSYTTAKAKWDEWKVTQKDL